MAKLLTKSDFKHLPLSGWFPGHMLKAGREMREILKLVDLVVELIDARAPAATRNPAFRQLLQSKPVALVANKADLADPRRSKLWKDWFAEQGYPILFLDSREIRETERLLTFWKRTVQEKRRERGVKRPLNRPVRLMIVGIPNVGKSTLVNRLHAGKKAQVGPKPGVTRNNQWVALRGDVELLDTPGVLWPHIRDKTHELCLALISSIRDEVMDAELLAEYLWAELAEQPENVDWGMYGLTACPEFPEDLMAAVAKRRGLLKAGGRLDGERVANAVIKDYRDGRLGRLTFEVPEVNKGE